MTQVRGACFIAVGLLATIFVVAIAASGGARTAREHVLGPQECGLATRDGASHEMDLPAIVDVTGAEVVALHSGSGTNSGTINIPLSVIDALETLARHASDAGYTVLHQDYEGFEAELYIAIRDRPGILRIIASRCSAYSRVSFQLPD